MRRDQAETGKTKTGAGSARKSPMKKKSAKKLVTGTTEILDFDLEAGEESCGKAVKGKRNENKARLSDEKRTLKRSKNASDTYGGNASGNPASGKKRAGRLQDVGDPARDDKKRSPKKDDSYMNFVPKKKEPAERKREERRAESRGLAKKTSGKMSVGKPEAAKTGSVRGEVEKKSAKKYSARKKKGGFFEDFSAMDAVIALTGVFVLLVAVAAIGVYNSANMVNKQVEAMASVGARMEEIGIAGEGIFTAVADSKVAGMEAAELSASEEVLSEYEEKELTAELSVGLKLTSVQRDLKIKFTNKKSGKLIGNQAFSVEVAGPEKKTFTDDDKDGVIYVKSITPGEYSVTITGPEEIDGNKAAGVNGIVTVKDKIEYKKIDVTDEVKKESEINAAKEDTAVANQVESALTDTVEWVESTKTALDEGGEAYEEVKKGDIPEPSAAAMLDMIWTADTKRGVYLPWNTGKPAENPQLLSDDSVRIREKGAYFTQNTETAADPALEETVTDPVRKEKESTPPSESTSPSEKPEPSQPEQPEREVSGNSVSADKKVAAVKIPDSVSVVTGGSAGLSLDIQPGDASDKSVEWRVAEGTDFVSVDGNGTVKGLKAGTAKVQVFAKDGSGIESNICTIKVSDDIGVSLEAPGSMTVGENKQLKCSTNGEIDSVKWSVSDIKVAVIDEGNGKVIGISAGKVTVTVKAKGKNGKEVSASGELTVNAAGVDGIRLDPAGVTIQVGEKKTIKASVSTEGNKAVKWKSGDEAIVKIVEAGEDSCIVQGQKPGRASIVAVSRENGDKTTACEVTVEMKDSSGRLKDRDGNQLYYKDGEDYREATAADYYKYDVFYRKKGTARYKYTGWQTIDGKRYYFDKNGNPVTGEQVIQGMKYTFNSDGSLQVNGIMGIDVSKHNGGIDWNAVRNSGVGFVIIRCGYRGSATGVLVEDQKFRENIQGASAAGLKVGIYFFSQAVNEVEAVEEASMAVSLIKNYKITYPVYMDVESANGRADGMDAGTRTQVINAFCRTISNSGYTAGVYSNTTWLGSRMNAGALGGYKIWLAQYAAAPTYGGRYEMWQYSSKGAIPGISGDVDLNISYMGY